MKLKLSRLFFASMALLAFAAVPARAQDLAAVKSSMSERLSKVDEFKGKGLIGENNKGFVEKRGAADGVDALVAAENKDREVVYAALAKQAGSSADAVGKARAKQIATSSAAGVWLQKEDGSWYKK